MRDFPHGNISCLMILVIVFLPPLALIIKWKGFVPFIVTTICTCFFWVLGSIAAAIYLGD